MIESAGFSKPNVSAHYVSAIFTRFEAFWSVRPNSLIEYGNLEGRLRAAFFK